MAGIPKSIPKPQHKMLRMPKMSAITALLSVCVGGA